MALLQTPQLWLALVALALVVVAILLVRAPLTLALDVAVLEEQYALLAQALYGPVGARLELSSEQKRPLLSLVFFKRWGLNRELGGSQKSADKKNTDEKNADKKNADKQGKDKKAKKKSWAQRRLKRHLGIPWLRLLRWVFAQKRCLTIQRFAASLKYGLEEPASTGMLYGFLSSVAGLLPKGFRFTQEPRFQEQILQGQGGMTLRIYPLQFLLSLLWFCASQVRFHILGRPQPARVIPGGKSQKTKTVAFKKAA